jgi:hypothetical protein
MPTRLQQRPRVLAALTFGVAGLLLPTLWFLPLIAPSHDRVVLVLYVTLPGLAGAIAGGLGGPLLHPTRCRSGSRAGLRGAAIGGAALVVFAPLFALGIKWTEPGWTNLLGLMLMTLWFSVLAIGWAVVIVGAFAGWLAWCLSQHVSSATA